MENSKLAIEFETGENFYLGDHNEIKFTVLENYGIVKHSESEDELPRQMVALLIKSNYAAVQHFELDQKLITVSKKNKG